MSYTKTKKTLKGIALLVLGIGMYQLGNHIGYESGMTRGVENTKQEIRRSIVDLHQKIARKESEAKNIWWNANNTAKEFTYGEANRFEADAYRDCYNKISDVINYGIDRLTKEDMVKRIEFDKKYNKSYSFP